MKRQKILNDPVYGFVTVPYGIIYDLIEHPYFQRLRRIKQVSLTHYVYPGALHTRFHHALGAYHLMQEAIAVLRGKGTDISDEEAEAAGIAILLHDIGHGPFSHTLEHTLIQIHHEELSVLFMERLNEHFEGQLSLAIRIFKDEYPKRFLHQLVSSQLDMDRMDYLNRDSYFTGVSEGVIGYDRIIKMLAVHAGELVVEEKGLYSIEKFLIARRLMYWQVYLHKTVVSAEKMLVNTLRRAKDLVAAGTEVWASTALRFFLQHQQLSREDFHTRRDELLDRFAELDDTDIALALKEWQHHPDEILAFLSASLVQRRLFRLEFQNEPFAEAHIADLRDRLQAAAWPAQAADYLLFQGVETNAAYSSLQEEISILLKSGVVAPMSQLADHGIQPRVYTKYYLGYPKQLGQKTS